MNRTPRHILVLRFSALGDVGMTVPAIYSFARQHPDVKVTLATRPFFARLFAGAPANVNIEAVDLKEYKGIAGLFRLLKRMKSIGADAVADLHDQPRTRAIGAWMRLHGLPVARVRKNRSRRKRALREKIPQRNFIDRFADTFRELGFTMKVNEPMSVRTWPAPPFIPEAGAIGIAPFARYATKTCPPERMREVCGILASEGHDIYLFGGRGAEEAALAEWEHDSVRIHNVAGKYTLEEEIALMGRMQAMVSMDSANQHLASLAGARVLTVWGATTPACGFMPYGQSSNDSYVRNSSCQPCSVAGTKECPMGHPCCEAFPSAETLVSFILQRINDK